MRVTGTVGRTIGRFGILVPVALAAVLNIASPCGYPPDTWGVIDVGRSADGSSLVAITDDAGAFVSSDDGLAWAETAEELRETARLGTGFDHGDRGRVVETNGQTYLVGNSYVLREREVLYSYGYLQTPGNIWAQSVRKRDIPLGGVLTAAPTSYFYDMQTGNLVLAMGLQGAVLVSPDGSPRRVAVGPHSPTDFSLTGKTKTLFAAILQPDSSYTNGVAVLLAFTLAVLAIAGPRSPSGAAEYFFIGAGIAALAAASIGVYPAPNGAQYEVFGGLVLMFTGLGALPIFVVGAGLVRARTGVRSMAAILAATLGILVVFLFGALVLFQFGLAVANLLAVGVAILIALAIWSYQFRYWPIPLRGWSRP